MMKLYTYVLNSYTNNEYNLQVRLPSFIDCINSTGYTGTNFPVYPHISIAS